MLEVTATEFTRNFGRFREAAQREPIAVTSHGRPTGYFLSAVEFEELQRLKVYQRKSFAMADLTDQEIAELEAVRMGPEYDHLNAILDEDQA